MRDELGLATPLSLLVTRPKVFTLNYCVEIRYNVVYIFICFIDTNLKLL